MKKYDVAIIGAGPSGLTAAAIASKGGKSVIVFERNEAPAKKIFATGNGRCNYLNKKADNFKVLYDYCTEIGIIGTEEAEGRMYPRNREASTVVNVLVNAAEKSEIVCNSAVSSVQKIEHGFVVKSDKLDVEAEKVVIACGGKAGIQYGCYGDGFRIATGFGLSVRKPIPALVGLTVDENIEMLHGVRLNAKASLLLDGEVIAADTGEVQFTKDSISGICVMNLSRFYRLDGDKKFVLKLDMYPEYTQEELLELFMHQKAAAGCAMEGLVPKKMHDYLHTRIKPEEHGPVVMSKLSKDLCFTVSGTRGWKDAQTTSGGVLLTEFDENMQSTKIHGLYFAGEVLDYDGPCGGYNLSWAFDTGIKVGKALLK